MMNQKKILFMAAIMNQETAGKIMNIDNVMQRCKFYKMSVILVLPFRQYLPNQLLSFDEKSLVYVKQSFYRMVMNSAFPSGDFSKENCLFYSDYFNDLQNHQTGNNLLTNSNFLRILFRWHLSARSLITAIMFTESERTTTISLRDDSAQCSKKDFHSTSCHSISER
jgi:hypothetical protein